MTMNKPSGWRVHSIMAEENMVYLVHDDSPVIKKYGLPEIICNAEVQGDYVLVTCVNDSVWKIEISDGSRRKLNNGHVS